MEVGSRGKEDVADRQFPILAETVLKNIGCSVALKEIRPVPVSGQDDLLKVGELLLVGG